MNLSFAEAIEIGLERNSRILKKKDQINQIKRKILLLEESKGWQWEAKVEGRALSNNTRTSSLKRFATIEGEKKFKQGLTIKPEIYLKEKELLEKGLTKDQINFDLQVEQPLYPFELMSLDEDYQRLSLDLAVANSKLEELQEDLEVEFLEDYLKLIELKLEVEIKEEEEELAQAYVAEERSRYQDSQEKRKDLLKEEIDLKQAQQNLLKITQKYQRLYDKLSYNLGLTKEQQLKIVDRGDLSLLAELKKEVVNLNDKEELFSKAQENSFKLLIKQLEKSEVEEEIKWQEVEGKPQLKFKGNYNSDQQWKIALELEHKLFNSSEEHLEREGLMNELAEIDREAGEYLYKLKDEINQLLDKISINQLELEEVKLRLAEADLKLTEAKARLVQGKLNDLKYRKRELKCKKLQLKLKEIDNELLVSRYKLLKLVTNKQQLANSREEE